MVYVLFDEPLYFQINGNRQQSKRVEALRLLESHARHLNCAFVDYEARLILAPEGNAVMRQKMIGACFSDDYIIQAERVAKNQFMVIGAKRSKVHEVYDGLLPLKIDQLIPYSLGMRAYLNQLGHLKEEDLVVSVDDLNSYMVINIFEGNCFSAPRRLEIKQTPQLVSEVKRSLQHYLSDHLPSRDKQVVIASNNADWLAVLGVEIDGANTVHLKSTCPCLDGMGAARFNMHFKSLEDILRQKRREQLLNRIKSAVLSAFILLIGFGAYGAAWAYHAQGAKRYQEAHQRLSELKRLLMIGNQRKLMDILQKEGLINPAEIYYEFYQRVPSGYKVKEWCLRSKGQGRWLFEGSIYPFSIGVTPASFKQTGIFQDSKISAVMVNKVLGQVVSLSIKGEVDL